MGVDFWGRIFNFVFCVVLGWLWNLLWMFIMDVYYGYFYLSIIVVLKPT